MLRDTKQQLVAMRRDAMMRQDVNTMRWREVTQWWEKSHDDENWRNDTTRWQKLTRWCSATLQHDGAATRHKEQRQQDAITTRSKNEMLQDGGQRQGRGWRQQGEMRKGQGRRRQQGWEGEGEREEVRGRVRKTTRAGARSVSGGIVRCGLHGVSLVLRIFYKHIRVSFKVLEYLEYF